MIEVFTTAEKREYLQLLVQIQRGVNVMSEKDPGMTRPELIRAALNANLIEVGAITGALIEQGLLDVELYKKHLFEQMRAEINAVRNQSR